MSYLDKPTQDQSLNGIITISDGVIEICNGEISGLSDLDISGNLNVGNDAIITHDCLINNDLTVTGNLNVGGVVENFDTVINNKTSSTNNQSRYINNKNTNSNNINCTLVQSKNITTENIKCKKILTNQLIIKRSIVLSSSDTGQIGELKFDDNYIYLCVGVNTWKRVALNNF